MTNAAIIEAAAKLTGGGLTMEWINETPKEPKMCRVSAAVLACLLCVLAGIMALRWEIRPEHPHLVRPVWTVEYVEVEQ